MNFFPRLVFALVLLASLVPRARALDVVPDLPTPKVLALSAALPTPMIALHPTWLSASLVQEEAPKTFEADLRVSKKMARAGYGVAAGLGLVLGGAAVAAQTRPKHWEFSNGICYDSREGERNYLVASSAIMAAGIALSSGMLVRLLKLRRALPDTRPSRRARVGQALLGIVSAGVTTTVLMGPTVGCASS